VRPPLYSEAMGVFQHSFRLSITVFGE